VILYGLSLPALDGIIVTRGGSSKAVLLGGRGKHWSLAIGFRTSIFWMMKPNLIF